MNNSARVLWFDPQELDVRKDQPVIVNTSKGTEYGVATQDVIEVSEDLIKSLKAPLKSVERIATEDDIERAEELSRKATVALGRFRELATELSLDMRPVSVEYLFDGEKAVFFFESEERVDFRELVRRLASEFHIRVDMRQIGVRDGARMVGGLGHCGQELCCARMGGEFSPVSIRMAKEQNMSLNPQKISGVCGRLMCCLRYEFETYKEVNSRCPKMNGKVNTPDGVARVCNIDVPRETITVRTEDGSRVKIPLAEMEPPTEGKRPNTVGDEAYQRALDKDKPDLSASLAMFSSSTEFTGEDKLVDEESRKARSAKKAEAGDNRKRRRRRGGSKNGDSTKQSNEGNVSRGTQDSQKKDGASKNSDNKRRRNRRRGGSKKQGNDAANTEKPANNKTRRPGQNSSGLRNPESSSEQRQGNSPHRRARRRSHTSGGSTNKDEK